MSHSLVNGGYGDRVETAAFSVWPTEMIPDQVVNNCLGQGEVRRDRGHGVARGHLLELLICRAGGPLLLS